MSRHAQQLKRTLASLSHESQEYLSRMTSPLDLPPSFSHLSAPLAFDVQANIDQSTHPAITGYFELLSLANGAKSREACIKTGQENLIDASVKAQGFFAPPTSDIRSHMTWSDLIKQHHERWASVARPKVELFPDSLRLLFRNAQRKKIAEGESWSHLCGINEAITVDLYFGGQPIEIVKTNILAPTHEFNSNGLFLHLLALLLSNDLHPIALAYGLETGSERDILEERQALFPSRWYPDHKFTSFEPPDKLEEISELLENWSSDEEIKYAKKSGLWEEWADVRKEGRLAREHREHYGEPRRYIAF